MVLAMKRWLSLVGFALIGALTFTSSSQADDGSSPPIVIAHVAPTTGRFKLHAESDRRGAEMALREVNARGGVLGREIILIRSTRLEPLADTPHYSP